MSIINEYSTLGYELLCKEVEESKCKTKIFHENDYILTQGQSINYLYWVDMGTLSFDYTANNGKRYSLGNVFVSQFILGDIECLTDTQCQFSVIAKESIEVKLLPVKFFVNLLKTNANIGIWLSRRLSKSYQNDMHLTMNRFLQPLIYSIGWDIYERYINLRENVGFHLINKESERFGCSERTYRRVIKTLMESGLIEKSGNEVIITDENKLHSFLTEI